MRKFLWLSAMLQLLAYSADLASVAVLMRCFLRAGSTL
jgi:hypothetical protein